MRPHDGNLGKHVAFVPVHLVPVQFLASSMPLLQEESWSSAHTRQS